jgi:phosphoglycerate dehydrogenase-like enzyme
MIEGTEQAHGILRVGITPDARELDANPAGQEAYAWAWRNRAVDARWLVVQDGTLTVEALASTDAAIVLGPAVTRSHLEAARDLVVLARMGAGYDQIDVDACTEAGVALCVTSTAVRRPMAQAALAMLLALANRLPEHWESVRSGSWQSRYANIGVGIGSSVIGIIGFGGIAREFATLVRPFGSRLLTAWPRGTEADTTPFGVELVGLDELLSASRFVVVACPLTTETFHLLGREALRLMRRDAYLINIARGPIVDEGALVEALADHVIAGAALDVFEDEPLPSGSPLLRLPNVIATPHAIGWTDELFAETARLHRAIIRASVGGDVPPGLINKAVWTSEAAQERRHRLRDRISAGEVISALA